MKYRVCFALCTVGLLGGASTAHADDVASKQLPEELPYESGAKIERGYHLERRMDKDLFTGGATIFAVSYAPVFVYGLIGNLCIQCNKASSAPTVALVPVLGPTILGLESDSKNKGFVALGIVDSLAQLVGLSAMYMGFSRTVQARDSAVIAPRVRAVTIAPVGDQGHGVFLGGTFLRTPTTTARPHDTTRSLPKTSQPGAIF